MRGQVILGLTILVVILYACPVRAQLPGQDGFVLPKPVTYDYLFTLWTCIRKERCATPACRNYTDTIRAFIAEYERPGDAGNVYLGPHPSWQSLYRKGNAEMDALLGKYRPRWPSICRTMVTIVKKAVSGSSLIPWSFDIGRRITRPGLDCLGEIDAIVPPSVDRREAMNEAYGYCIVEPHAVCGRLKPPGKPPAQ